MKDLLIQKGFIIESSKPDVVAAKSTISLFNLTTWLKKTLRLLGVQFEDCCEKATPTGYSIRMNLAKNHLEYYDPITFTWLPTPF